MIDLQQASLETRSTAWQIAGTTLPRRWLGDHGFMRRYGSKLHIKEITARMTYAVTRIGKIGLAAGDERCLRAADAVRSVVDPSVRLMYHTDLPLALNDQQIHFGRCMSTLRQAVQIWSPDYLTSDPIVGKFLASFARYRPYISDEINSLKLREDAFDQELDRVRRFSPDIITLGGDWLDFACAAGRDDLVRQTLAFFRRMCGPRGIPVLITTYTGPITAIAAHDVFPSEDYDGLMLCVNSLGQGMLPHREGLLAWAVSLAKPVLAMHILAIGKLAPLSAIDYAINGANTSAVVIGASQYQHIDEYADALVA